MAHCGTGSASCAGTPNRRGEDRAGGGEFAFASWRAETGHVSPVGELAEAALRQRGLDVREPAAG
jgi:hypothetical protein